MPQTEFEFEIEMGESSQTVFCEYECSIYTENDYGADRDGNRGMKMDWIEDEKVTVFSAFGKDITSNIEEKYPQEFQKIIKKGEESI